MSTSILLDGSVDTRIIRLKKECPLYTLMDAFPDGIPVKGYLLSLNAEDFYELNPALLPDGRSLIELARALTVCPPSIHYALERHHVIAIPCEWGEEVN